MTLKGLALHLGLIVMALACAFADGTASAATLTSPSGTEYTGALQASLEQSLTLTSNYFVTVHCSDSTLSGNVEQHGAHSPVGGKLSILHIGKCSDEVTVGKPGRLDIHEDNTVTSSGAEIRVHTTVGECVFTTLNTDIGSIVNGPGTARLVVDSRSIPQTGSNFFAPRLQYWRGAT